MKVRSGRTSVRTVITLLSSAIVWLAVATPPSAASCPAATISVGSRTVTPGDEVVVTGEHWATSCNDAPTGCLPRSREPFSDIKVSIRSVADPQANVVLGTVTVPDDFAFSFDARIPELPPGRYFLEAVAEHPVSPVARVRLAIDEPPR